jgi:ribokinase
MDLVLKTSRRPRPGDSLIGERYHFLPSGKRTNQAIAAVRLGAEVSLTGRLGQDEATWSEDYDDASDFP